MPQPQFSQQAAKLQHLLDHVSPLLARQSGFVKRHSKLTGDIFIKSLVLGWLKHPTASLSTLTQHTAELGVSLSPQGLAQRFNPATVAYTQALFAQALQSMQTQDLVKIPLLTQFTGVYLLDSTSITLPSALQNTWAGCGGPGAKAGLKMHLTFEYLRGQISAIDLTDSKRSDRLYAPPQVPVGSLHLFDLGYFKLETFERLEQQQAFFISRLRSGSVLSSVPGQKPLDVAALCQSFSGDEHECRLWVGAKARLEVRVLFRRCPPAIADERRRKAHAAAKRKGWNCSAKHLALLDWNIFITNVPEERLTLAQVLQIYPLRWQIELLFKLCKSQLGLDQVRGCGEHRILTQLYIRLLLCVVLCHVSAPLRLVQQHELSLPKALMLLSGYAERLMRCCQRSWTSLPRLLSRFARDLTRFCQKTRRKRSPSTLAKLTAYNA